MSMCHPNNDLKTFSDKIYFQALIFEYKNTGKSRSLPLEFSKLQTYIKLWCRKGTNTLAYCTDRVDGKWEK